MAAQEQQRQRVVGGRRVVGVGSRCEVRLGWSLGRHRHLAVVAGRVTAPRVGQRRVATVISQPMGVRRDTLLRPLHRGRQQRLLQRVLAGVEVAVMADERTETRRRQTSQQGLDLAVDAAVDVAHISRPAVSITDRTSTRSSSARAAGIMAATARARSRLSHSTRK